MTRWFESLPIHRKLITLALGVSAVALAAALSGLLLLDVGRFRASAEDDAHALAQIIAENTAAAIVFGDDGAARQTLGSVRVRPTVLFACVYRADGSLLAAFTRTSDASCPAIPQAQRTWQLVTSTADVTQNDRHVGMVLVARELSDLRARVTATAGAGLMMLLVGGAVALGLAQRLQRVVSRPIVALAHAAREIGREQRYELPPIDAPADETGELVRAFGDMVRRIGETNAALVASNDALRGEVDQRRRMQTEREVLLAREREASRLKDEFLAAVSHELRTPLNAILGWTQILQSTKPTEQTMARGIASLARNAEAQSRVIEDLLDISRIVTGKLQLTLAQVDLRSVVESAIEVIDPIAASKEIHLEADLPDVPCLVHGDYDRLRQVLWNLLTNAVKFTPAGGRVEVRLSRDRQGSVIEVRDNGIGVPAEFLAHVFERFRQADGSITRERGGLGLGLAIVKELVDLHGGRVLVSSDGEGRGATFTVCLPAASARHASSSRDLDAGGAITPGLRLDGVRVMVVDDNSDALDIVTMTLERVGAVVFAASSGPAAVDAWSLFRADVLLCDLAMPGVDGFEVLRRVRTIDAMSGRSTPALAVTAYASDSYRDRCMQAGFEGHLAKPYQLEQVVRAITTAIAERPAAP